MSNLQNIWTLVLILLAAASFTGCAAGPSFNPASPSGPLSGPPSLDQVSSPLSPPGPEGPPGGGGSGAAPPEQPTETVDLPSKRINLNGEVCFKTQAEPDCDSPFSAPVTVEAFKKKVDDAEWQPIDKLIEIAADGSFTDQEGYHLDHGVCKTLVRYRATYNPSSQQSYTAEVENLTCPVAGKDKPDWTLELAQEGLIQWDKIFGTGEKTL